MRAVWRATFVLFAVALSQCDRAPAEPVASANAQSKSRCLRRTSDTPPPAVTGPDARCPKDPDGSPAVPLGKITFPSSPKAKPAEVELMMTEAHRERGLMYRTAMDEDHGMLFVFLDTDVRSFWMHNTCIPLDMLFVAEDGFIAGVLENVPTMNDEPRSIPCPVKYVLEMNAGYARRHGIKAGQTVKIDGLPK